MIVRLFLFAIMAIGLAGFGAVAWVSAHPPKAAIHKVMPRTEAVIALAHDVRAGTLLKSDDLEAKTVPTTDVPTDATPDSADARRDLIGGMIRRSLTTGDVILPADVMRPGDHGFLAAVLQPGMRAVTIGVDAVSGTAGLIWPGDRVDVIMTQSIDDASVPLGRRVSAEAVLSNVRVIAIDQELVQGAAPGAPATATSTARTVTLEVTETGVERVQLATRIGKLSLAVCSADAGAASSKNGGRTIWAQDVSQAMADLPSAKSQAAAVHVFQGSDEQDFHF